MKLSETQLSKILKDRESLRTQIEKVRTAVVTIRQFEEWKVTGNLTARQSIKILFIIVSTDSPYWETENLVYKMTQGAFFHNYEGMWQHVQAMLELEPTFENYIEYFLENIGNFNDLQNYLNMKGIMLRPKYYSSVLDRHPVHYPQRKRGYDDKGSRRFPHEYHGEDLQLGEIEREDRRSLISHPLVRERFKTSQENVAKSSAYERKENQL